MHDSIIVVDDFYRDPAEVRDFALKQAFVVKGNYPGARTQAFLHDGIFSSVQSIVRLPIVHWPSEGYHGAFQYSVATDQTWVHADPTTVWSGVVYLTPDAPLSAGTAFFQHRDTGLDWYPDEATPRQMCDGDAAHPERWLLTDQVANRFNRLVLFRGRRFHSSQGHFGSTKEDGRLFQTFFFNTAF